MMCFKRNHLKFTNKNIILYCRALNTYSHSLIVYLLHDKDLAFCYSLLRNDKVMIMYKTFQNSVSLKSQLFLAFLDYYIRSVSKISISLQ